jgi:endonuclease/exonuclease/phosphatase family metal-dependent hydrolase
MRIVAWNIGHRSQSWYEVMETGADVALLQEACQPPRDIREHLGLEEHGWTTDGVGYVRWWRTAVIPLNRSLRDRNQFYAIPEKHLSEAKVGEFGISRLGTISAADIINDTGETITVVSIYGLPEKPRVPVAGCTVYSDAHVHRLISDLSWFVTRRNNHKVIVAGDLNLTPRHGDAGRDYWSRRYATVFERMEALGLPLIGPGSPEDGLDHVFVSEEIARRVVTRVHARPRDASPSNSSKIEIVVT